MSALFFDAGYFIALNYTRDQNYAAGAISKPIRINAIP